MKRLLLLLFTATLGAGLAVAQDQGISLGDAARMQRDKKGQTSPNAKVYDNENLPKSGAISTTTGDYAGVAATPSRSSSSSSSTSASASSTTAAAAGKDTKSAEDSSKEQEAEFRTQVAEAKKNIDQLSRELDIMQREQRLRAAAFYGDAGVRARPENQAKYLSDEKQYQETLKSKQGELDAAKQALDQVRDNIRKAGLPSTIGE
jgi:hypothetical protein